MIYIMAIYGHSEHMVQANISELKNNLSAYVAQVRAGETVLILDRHTPVARMVALDGNERVLVREPTVPKEQIMRRSSVHMKDLVDVVDLLRSLRDER
jgi:antitoxin (DNA-binding transcriptional repressor) of toxin-antitoxin stability system